MKGAEVTKIRIQLKRAILSLLAFLLLVATVYAAYEYWYGLQTITQNIHENATVGSALNYALPDAFLNAPATHTKARALNITTYVANARIWVNSTRWNELVGFYSQLTLHLRDTGTTNDKLVRDLLEFSGSFIIQDIGSYTFDYYIEYTAKSIGSASIQLSVGGY